MERIWKPSLCHIYLPCMALERLEQCRGWILEEEGEFIWEVRSPDSSIGQPEALSEGSFKLQLTLSILAGKSDKGLESQWEMETRLTPSLPTAVAITAPIFSLCPGSFPLNTLVLQYETCLCSHYSRGPSLVQWDIWYHSTHRQPCLALPPPPRALDSGHH